jgi:hypothetical protein
MCCDQVIKKKTGENYSEIVGAEISLLELC